MNTEPTGRVTTESVSMRTVLDTIFELFQDDQMVLVELDPGGRVVRCNTGYTTACGWDRDSVAGVYPPDAFVVKTRSGNAECEAYSQADEEIWQTSHGEHRRVRWLKLWAFRGQSIVKLGILEPVEGDDAAFTEATQTQFRAFLDAAPDAIITIDESGTMVSANPATEKLFGYAPAELLGRNVSMLMPSPDRERHNEYLKRYLETGEARIIGIGRDISALRKDGSTFPARLSVSEFSAQGAGYFTGILHDISERIEAEEQQRAMFAEHAHASRVVALGEMASSIAHEINQPLTAIISYADASRKLIELGQEDRETLDHALKQIAGQGQRAGEIIRRLRDFVRKKVPDRSTSDINDIVKTAAAFTSHDIERYGVSMTLDLEPEPLTTRVDRLQIEQVVLNLIRNSLDAIQDARIQDGHIKVTSRLDDDYVSISISDNGPGIKPSEYGNVFDAFYTTKETGTGLGLSISHSILEAHGGTLTFTPNETSGVTFTLKMPASNDD